MASCPKSIFIHLDINSCNRSHRMAVGNGLFPIPHVYGTGQSPHPTF